MILSLILIVGCTKNYYVEQNVPVNSISEQSSENVEWLEISGSCKATDYRPPISTDEGKVCEFNCIDGGWKIKCESVKCTLNKHCNSGEICDTKDYTCKVIEGGGNGMG